MLSIHFPFCTRSLPHGIDRPLRPAAGRVFPFGLGGQPLAGPLAIRDRVVPRDMHDRMLHAVVDRRTSGPSGCRQLAPLTYFHTWYGQSGSSLVSVRRSKCSLKQIEPATRFSAGISFDVGDQAAEVFSLGRALGDGEIMRSRRRTP